MRELRQNPVTGRWVLVASERGRRPVEGQAPGAGGGGDGAPPSGAAGRGEVGSGPDPDPDCPFCPGNEERLPDVLWELPASGPPGWRCRAVPNKYPAVVPERTGQGGSERGPVLVEGPGARAPEASGIAARGRHEVLIETPRHRGDPRGMSGQELEALVALYAARLERLVREEPGLTPVLFRNRGPGAGASLRHPHAQLLALRRVPPDTALREARLEAHQRRTGRCLLCGILEAEPGGEERLVLEEEHLRAFVPRAPERPLELWVVPRAHRAAFPDTTAGERASLARILGRLLAAVGTVSGDADYNYILHTAPGARRRDPALHWFLQIRPVTARVAGFEQATGIFINPALPEEDAARLRAAVDRPESTERPHAPRDERGRPRP